jgi:hypothetical protein
MMVLLLVLHSAAPVAPRAATTVPTTTTGTTAGTYADAVLTCCARPFPRPTAVLPLPLLSPRTRMRCTAPHTPRTPGTAACAGGLAVRVQPIATATATLPLAPHTRSSSIDAAIPDRALRTIPLLLLLPLMLL